MRRRRAQRVSRHARALRKAIRGEDLPREIDVKHPVDREGILFPDKRTTLA